MEETTEHRPPKFTTKPLNNLYNEKWKDLEVEIDETKKSPQKNTSPKISPKGQPTMAKSASGRSNCLCSPTTHAGSFRCRHHRSEGGFRRAGSVGSNLSNLANKSVEL